MTTKRFNYFFNATTKSHVRIYHFPVIYIRLLKVTKHQRDKQTKFAYLADF